MITQEEIAAAYKKYVAKQRQGRQRGWMLYELFEQSYKTMSHIREAYGPK